MIKQQKSEPEVDTGVVSHQQRGGISSLLMQFFRSPQVISTTFDVLGDDEKNIFLQIVELLQDITKHMQRVKLSPGELQKSFGNPCLEELWREKKVHYSGACNEYACLVMKQLSDIDPQCKPALEVYLLGRQLEKGGNRSHSLVPHTCVSFHYHGKKYYLDNMQAGCFHLSVTKPFFHKIDAHSGQVLSTDLHQTLFKYLSIPQSERAPDVRFLDIAKKLYPLRAHLLKTGIQQQVTSYTARLEYEQVLDLKPTHRIMKQHDKTILMHEEGVG